jgi:hypothetical protein
MTRTFVAIPSVGVVDTRFAISLASLRKPPGMALAASPRSMPDIARNGLFDQAVKFNYDYVFFLDDDMVLDTGTLVQLQQEMDSNPSIDVLSAMAFRRHPPFHPCVLRKMENGTYDPLTKFDCGVIEVDATHFAATLVRASTLSKVPAPRFEFKLQGQVKGEDVVLSEKLVAAGAKLFCDTSIEALHIGLPPLIGRKAYESVNRPQQVLIVP